MNAKNVRASATKVSVPVDRVLNWLYSINHNIKHFEHYSQWGYSVYLLTYPVCLIYQKIKIMFSLTHSAIVVCVVQFLAPAIIQVSQASAQLLHPSDMAVGRWKVSLHRRDRSLVESMIFPRIGAVEKDSNFVKVGGKKHHHPQDDLSPQSVKFSRRIDCELILDADGSFVLTPSHLNDKKKNFKGHGYTEPNCSPLRGKWQVLPNPYCVTDRHFDELSLKSFPKIKAKVNGEGPMGSAKNEQIRMEMHCRIWGRFGSNTVRYFLKRPRGRDAGRMVQGKLSILKVESDGRFDADDFERLSTSKRRVLCATFSGTRQ